MCVYQRRLKANYAGSRQREDGRLSVFSRLYASNDRSIALWSSPLATAIIARCSPSLFRALTMFFLVFVLTAAWILFVIP